MTSLLAKVCRLQCHEYSGTFASSRAEWNIPDYGWKHPACLAFNRSEAVPFTIVDSDTQVNGGSYTDAIKYAATDGENQFSYRTGIPAGITQVAAFTSDRASLIALEIAGTGTVDALGTPSYSSFSNSGNTGAVTTANAHDAIFGFQTGSNTGTGFARTSSDCAVEGNVNSSTLSGNMSLFYKSESTTGSYSCSFATTSSENAATFTVAIKQ